MDPPLPAPRFISPFRCGQLPHVCNFSNCCLCFSYSLFTSCLLLSEPGPSEAAAVGEARSSAWSCLLTGSLSSLRGDEDVKHKCLSPHTSLGRQSPLRPAAVGFSNHGPAGRHVMPAP